MGKSGCTKGSTGELIYTITVSDKKPATGLQAEKWFQVNHPVKDYKPSELSIVVKKGIIRLDGVHKSELASRSFFKEFIIPKGVNHEGLEITFCLETSTLSILAEINGGQSIVKKVTRTANVTVKSSIDYSSKIETSTYEDLSNSTKIVDQEKKFETSLNLSEFEPEEIYIVITRTLVIIQTKISVSSKKEIRKCFTIPEGVNPEKISNSLNPAGQLTITAPIEPKPKQNNETVTIKTVKRDTKDSCKSKTLNSLTTTRETFEVSVNLSEYSVEEVSVTVVKRRIIIDAQHVSECERKSYHKEFPLPEGATPEGVESSISPSGVLTITGRFTTTQTTTTTKTTLEQVTTQNKSRVDKDTVLSPSFSCEDPDADNPNFEDVSNKSVVKDGKFETNVNLEEYSAEEITIKVFKSTIKVVARKNVTTSTVKKETLKKIAIPSGVDPESVTTNLGKNGVLTITAKSTNKKQQETTTTTTTKTIKEKRTENVVVKQVVDLNKEIKDIPEGEDISDQIKIVDKKMKVSLNVSTYEVEEITITIFKRTLVIVTKCTTSNKTLVRKFTIPNDVEPGKISNVLTPSGELIISGAVDTQHITNVDKKTETATKLTETTKKTTTKSTIKTTIVTKESLMKSGYNFENAKTEVYKGDPKFFEKTLTIPEYKAEELEIKIAENWVILEGKQEMSPENGMRSKSFMKMFTVPKGVNPEEISCILSDDAKELRCTAVIWET